MTKNNVPGTSGYEKAITAFTEASLALSFEEINAEFLPLLPSAPARVLDAGSGVGQNSAMLANRGYSVVSVEPLFEFHQIAKAKFSDLGITWINDSLPKLEKIDVSSGLFDFVLIDGVWHHLTTTERKACIQRLSAIIQIGGVCAISLRNGPAGVGKHVFSTHCDELIGYAEEFGFKFILVSENQPSKMKNKPDVFWSRVALQKL